MLEGADNQLMQVLIALYLPAAAVAESAALELVCIQKFARFEAVYGSLVVLISAVLATSVADMIASVKAF